MVYYYVITLLSDGYCFLENPEDAAIRAMTLGFELPRNFNNVDNYSPGNVDQAIFRSVPDVVTAGIMDAIELPVFDATIPFIFLKHGFLPEFTVVYFMNVQPKGRISNSTRFFRALHLVEMYREYLMGGPACVVEEEESGIEPVDGPSGRE